MQTFPNIIKQFMLYFDAILVGEKEKKNKPSMCKYFMHTGDKLVRDEVYYSSNIN